MKKKNRAGLCFSMTLDFITKLQSSKHYGTNQIYRSMEWDRKIRN